MRYPDGGGLDAAERARREQVRLEAAAMIEAPVVKVTGGHDTRVSLAALIAVRPGRRPRLIFRTHRARRGLNTHTSRAMRELIAARDRLTVYQLPASPDAVPARPPGGLPGQDQTRPHHASVT